MMGMSGLEHFVLPCCHGLEEQDLATVDWGSVAAEQPLPDMHQLTALTYLRMPDDTSLGYPKLMPPDLRELHTCTPLSADTTRQLSVLTMVDYALIGALRQPLLGLTALQDLEV